MVPNENGLKKYFIIEIGTWFLVSKGKPHRAINVQILKLKYCVVLEKMALKDDTLLGIPNSKTRLAAKQRWMLLQIYGYIL